MAAVTVATDFVEMGRKDSELGWEVLALIRFDRAARLHSLALGPDHLNVTLAIDEMDDLYRAAVERLTSLAIAERREGARSLRRLLTERVPKRGHYLHGILEPSLVEAARDQDPEIRSEAEQALALFRSARE